jgi:hypothetical protein
MTAVARGSRFLLAASLAAGCRRDAAPGSDASVADARPDVALPETVVIVLDAGADPGVPAPPPRKIVLLSGLPRPCQDRALGTVTFAQVEDKVVVTSSKTKARATCDAAEPGLLLCDWVGPDGKSSIRAPLTYGPKKKITGKYDARHTLACPAQP